jgi:hypothetical protein
MKVLTCLNPIDQSVPTLQSDKQGPLILCPSNEGQSKLVFGPSCWKGVWLHICLCMVMEEGCVAKAKVGN